MGINDVPIWVKLNNEVAIGSLTQNRRRQWIDYISIGFVEFAKFRRECRTLFLLTFASFSAANRIVVLYVKSLRISFSTYLLPRLIVFYFIPCLVRGFKKNR